MQPFRSRRVCGRTTAVFLSYIVLALIFSLAGSVLGKGAKGGKGGKKKGNTAVSSATPANGEQSLTNIPLPIGHEAKGLVLPDFDLEGHLRGKFVAGSARRIDEEHVGFRDLKITTFTDENKIDLQIDTQTSVLDLKTRVLTSQERTTVKRADFNIVGDSVEFDTGTRTGRMVGNVKMVISDQSHLMEKTNQ
ncbi:MAG: hypothetical protein QOI34_1206 [Verrucomicrobiota bacterium]